MPAIGRWTPEAQLTLWKHAVPDMRPVIDARAP
jgi:hypothetical protein